MSLNRRDSATLPTSGGFRTAPFYPETRTCSLLPNRESTQRGERSLERALSAASSLVVVATRSLQRRLEGALDSPGTRLPEEGCLGWVESNQKYLEPLACHGMLEGGVRGRGFLVTWPVRAPLRIRSWNSPKLCRPVIPTSSLPLESPPFISASN